MAKIRNFDILADIFYAQTPYGHYFFFQKSRKERAIMLQFNSSSNQSNSLFLLTCRVNGLMTNYKHKETKKNKLKTTVKPITKQNQNIIVRFKLKSKLK